MESGSLHLHPDPGVSKSPALENLDIFCHAQALSQNNYLIEVVDIFFFLYYVPAEFFSKSLEFVCYHRVKEKNNL